jgi:hypothetical protein
LRKIGLVRDVALAHGVSWPRRSSRAARMPLGIGDLHPAQRDVGFLVYSCDAWAAGFRPPVGLRRFLGCPGVFRMAET